MKLNENVNEAAIGLDVGTSRIVTASPDGGEVRFRAQLNAFVNIPYSKLTESTLVREGIPFRAAGGSITVYGDESERFAGLLNAEIRRPMTRGVLNAGEPDGLTLIREAVRRMTGGASHKGQKLCFSVPAAAAGAAENVTYHEAALRKTMSDLGFQVKSVPEGLAVVFGELEGTNYTGIGISCGGGLCNVCLAYLSVPVLSFSVAKAGDFVDASAAAVTGERANVVRMQKEAAFHINGSYTDKVTQALGVYYDEMIQTLITEMRQAFASARGIPKLGRPVPIVLSGGSAMPEGFRERFEQVFREGDFPIPVSEVRLAGDPRTSAAKGALVAALSDM